MPEPIVNNEDASKTAPSEVKGHVLSADEITEWGNETVLVEPTVTTEAGGEAKAPEEEAEDTTTTEEVEEEQQEEEFQAPQLPQVEDPGEYTPKDYSFEVTVYDDEGKNGKTTKIKSIEQWEELLDKDPNFGASSALLKAQRLATKMESSLERDEADWQAKKDKFDEAKQVIDQQAEAIANVAAEINYLVAKGKLPAVDKKYENADWADPEVAKQPGVKEQLALLNYMRKENDTRRKAGLKSQVSVLDAFNAMQLEQRDKKAENTKKAAGEARKQAGAQVAGVSPAPISSPAPKGIAVGRGGSLRDLGNSW